MCVDKNISSNEATVEHIKKKGGTAISYKCDITKRQNVHTLATQLKKDLGFVSMLFYCCGIPSPRSLMTQPPQDIHETLDLTLTSYFWVRNFRYEFEYTYCLYLKIGYKGLLHSNHTVLM